MSKKPVEIARASYEAYVQNDRSAIEALIADDFISPARLTTESIDARISGYAGPTAKVSRPSTSSTWCPMATGYSLPMKARVRTVGDSVTPRS